MSPVPDFKAHVYAYVPVPSNLRQKWVWMLHLLLTCCVILSNFLSDDFFMSFLGLLWYLL